jgi:4-alpha-glucanotransferase
VTVTEVNAPSAALRRLAKLYGVELSYTDAARQRQRTSAESVVATLRALGADVEGEGDIDEALWHHQRELLSRLVEPVTVAWDGTPPEIEVRIPAGVESTIEAELALEGGETRRWTAAVESLPATRRARIRREEFVSRTLALKVRRLPQGYHRLTMRVGRESAECLVISAPRKAYTGERGEQPAWGVFLPLYALHGQRSWGSGDFTDLARLAEWVASMGGTTVSTLPLFATFLDEPFEPSPYTPASRLFWNEFFLDVTAAPELASCEPARKIVASAEFAGEVDKLRREETVDYKCGMALKRRVLAELAKSCFDGAPERPRALRQFVRERPAVEDYARFRAVAEWRGESWPSWPERLREGRIDEGDYDEEARRYHLYVQLLAHEQLTALCKSAANVRLYFDLPVGSSGNSYDVWRERDVFVSHLSGGAPPDALFSLGQDWGFPPMHPEKLRQQQYRYYRAIIGNLLRYGRVLRIDHVMGLHHMYCVPRGMDARHGVYVRFPAEEMYAILSLESHRHRALIVGEDLGTVPGYVHKAMSRHAIHRTYVVQYEATPGAADPQPGPRSLSVAALNTHDMPPFAAYWHGLDADDRFDLWLMDEEQALKERTSSSQTREAIIRKLRAKKLLGEGEPSAGEVTKALLRNLGESRAHFVLANLEDLWGETRPQNVPGTTGELVNWRRKARYSLKDMRQLPEVTGTLRSLDKARRHGRGVK